MIKDPFVIEQILVNHYGHLGKWYRVESHTDEGDTLSVELTFSSLDGHEFGRMSVTLIYDKETIDKIMSMRTAVRQNYSLVDDCLITVWGLDGVLKTIGTYIKQYSRDSKIDELLQ